MKDSFIKKFEEGKSSKVSDYAELIDPLIRGAIYSIDNETKFAILNLLKLNPDLSFSNIMKILEIDQSKLNSNLDKLQKGSLLKNFLEKREGTKEYSFYELTYFGRTFLDQIKSLIEPERNFFENSNIRVTKGEHGSFSFLKLEDKELKTETIQCFKKEKTDQKTFKSKNYVNIRTKTKMAIKTQN